MVALVLASAACARRVPPHATALDAQRANVELAALEDGRTLLVRKCSGCHRTPMPRDQAAARWPALVDEMAERSSLDAHERQLVLQYLLVMRDATPAK